jgi:predicted NUDIX family NTP pyrophosphohydrolase
MVAAGLLMCRWTDDSLEYFLVHPGGPFFAKKDTNVWSIPKGIPEEGEQLLETALREFKEETGITPTPPYFLLTPVKQKGGKRVHAWTFLGEWNPAQGIVSNTFKLEWPPKSGRFQEYPEQDRAAWMQLNDAKSAIRDVQVSFLEEALIIHTKEKTSE